MEVHLDAEQRAKGNRRNDKVSKQVRTSDGTIEVESSRDRWASFEPQIIKKRETVLAENLEPRILSMYEFAGHFGSSQGHVRHGHLPRHLGRPD